MSSTNDTHQHLYVQAQPKSILKKSPSPKFLDSSMSSDNNQHNTKILSSISENEKNGIDPSTLNNNNHTCVLDDNQSITMDNSTLSFLETPINQLPMISHENLYQYKIDPRLIGKNPPNESPRSSSEGEHEHQQYRHNQQRMKIKSKKNHYRSLVVDGTLSSSDSSSDNNNDERKAKRTMIESKTTSIHSNKSRSKDMQLDEFMRKYQQQGGIPIPPIKEYRIHDQLTPRDLFNNNGKNNHDFPFQKQRNPFNEKRFTMDDTLSLLESIDKMTLSQKCFSPLQLLFDVARTNELDRRTKIDHIRQYVEEEIGITAFLTTYKLLKSSQIPIDIQRQPFCHYANFIPHLCCLIMLESEQQKNRL